MSQKSFLESIKLEPPENEAEGSLETPRSSLDIEKVFASEIIMLKNTGIKDSIEKIFAMSKVEFIRFRNAGSFTPNQLKTLTVVRKQYILHLRKQKRPNPRPSKTNLKLKMPLDEVPTTSKSNNDIDFIQLPPNATKHELQTFLNNAGIEKSIDELTYMDRKDFLRFWKHSGFSEAQKQLIRDVRYRIIRQFSYIKKAISSAPEEDPRFSTPEKMQEVLEENGINLKVDDLTQMSKDTYLRLIYRCKEEGRVFTDDQIEVIKKCRHRLLAIKSGLLKNASSDEPPLDDSNQNSALTPTTSINNFINVQSKSPRKSRSKSFSNLPLAEFIVNMEKLLKEAGINNVQIEELFSMSNNEFKKFRSSQDFMEKQQKVMGLVRKRYASFLRNQKKSLHNIEANSIKLEAFEPMERFEIEPKTFSQASTIYPGHVYRYGFKNFMPGGIEIYECINCRDAASGYKKTLKTIQLSQGEILTTDDDEFGHVCVPAELMRQSYDLS